MAECRAMNRVLSELLSAEGSEPYLRSAKTYTKHEGENLSFWDICLRARTKREVCMGYKPAEVDFPDSVNTLLNPPNKDEKRAWMHGDLLVILSAE